MSFNIDDLKPGYTILFLSNRPAKIDYVYDSTGYNVVNEIHNVVKIKAHKKWTNNNNFYMFEITLTTGEKSLRVINKSEIIKVCNENQTYTLLESSV
jgi:hypothetical protein